MVIGAGRMKKILVTLVEEALMAMKVWVHPVAQEQGAVLITKANQDGVAAAADHLEWDNQATGAEAAVVMKIWVHQE
jgi:hypothetical protein